LNNIPTVSNTEIYPDNLACFRRHSLHWDSEDSVIQSSVDAVESYLSQVVDCIARSAPTCPLALRIVLRNIYLRASVKWPQHTYEVRIFVCACFLVFILHLILVNFIFTFNLGF
jgi:hypothetical protein